MPQFISFRRVFMVIVSFHSNRILTKTARQMFVTQAKCHWLTYESFAPQNKFTTERAKEDEHDFISTY